MRARGGFVFGLIVGGLVLLPSSGAVAHPDGNWYGLWWHSPQQPVVWRFEDSFPNAGNKRDRFVDAVQTWEDAAGDLEFDKQPDFTAASYDQCPQEGNSWIGWDNIPGPIGAQSHVCKFSDFPNQARSFFIIFDSSVDWYSGASTPPPADKVDIQAMATHELGHAGGFGHPLGTVNPEWGLNADGSVNSQEGFNVSRRPITRCAPLSTWALPTIDRSRLTMCIRSAVATDLRGRSPGMT